MRLTIRAFGLDLLDVELSTDATSPAPDDDDEEPDYSRDLSGGTIGYDRIEAGGDRYMGFTNGRGCE